MSLTYGVTVERQAFDGGNAHLRIVELLTSVGDNILEITSDGSVQRTVESLDSATTALIQKLRSL